MSKQLTPIDYTFNTDSSGRQQKIKGIDNVEVSVFLNLLNSRRGLFSDIPGFYKSLGELRYKDVNDLNILSHNLIEIADDYLRKGFIQGVEAVRDEDDSGVVYLDIKIDVEDIVGLSLGFIEDRIVAIKVIEDTYGSR